MDELATQEDVAAEVLRAVAELAEVCKMWHTVVHPGEFADCKLYRCERANRALRIPIQVRHG